MPIANYTGAQLLQAETLEAIQKEADLLLQYRDVAGAWQASRHIKEQLAALPPDQVKAVLDDYRHITTDLKVLALPLLDEAEVKSLLVNNLSFLDAKYGPALAAALPAWLATVATAQQAAKRDELMKLLPPDSPARANLALAAAPARPVGAPTPTINPVQALAMGTDVLFDKHEAAELSDHIKKVNDMGGAPLAVGGGTEVAANILALSQSTEDKETFLRRAGALITSRLRDVRSQADLREYLARPFKVGGLGLSAAVIDKAFALIEDEYNKLHNSTPAAPLPPVPAAPVPPPPASAPVPAVPSATPSLPPPSPAPVPVANVPVSTAPATPLTPPVLAKVAPTVAPVPLPPSPPKPEPVQIKPAPVIAVPPVAPQPIPPLPKAAATAVPDATGVVRPIQTAPPSNKPRVEDIKAPSARTVTAGDELRFLTLADWRKAGVTAAENVLQKVRLLGQESLASKAQGIKMFRESELFRQYVALGQASLAQGKKLAEVINDKIINPGNMTQDEFFAVALLNGKLK